MDRPYSVFGSLGTPGDKEVSHGYKY